MASLIIAVFRLLVYLLFIGITLGWTWMGYYNAWDIGVRPVIGAAGGLIIGFFNAVIVTGVMVILLDIQDSLRDLVSIARGELTGGGAVHHHHHHENGAVTTTAPPPNQDAA